MKFPKLKNKFILAPMAGINDCVFRLMCESQGASLTFTEMINAIGLQRKNKKTIKLMQILPSEKNVSVQLFGYCSKNFEDLNINNKFKIIDLNLGCPSKKVIRSGSGSALVKEPKKIENIMKTLVNNYEKPITAKIRKDKALEIGRIIEKSGASALAIHGRTISQGYSGKADWKIIKKLKKELSIPIIGNGDITCPKKAKEMLRYTDCDAVMIGRAALGNPFIFKQCIDYFNNHEYQKITKENKLKSLKEYLEKSSKLNFHKNHIKMQIHQFISRFKGASEIRKKINHADDINGLI